MGDLGLGDDGTQVVNWFAQTQSAAFVSQKSDGSPSNTVVLGPNYLYGPNTANFKNFQDRVAFHEMLHVYTGLNDVDLAAKLEIGNFANGTAASTAIQAWLKAGCTK